MLTVSSGGTPTNGGTVTVDSGGTLTDSGMLTVTSSHTRPTAAPSPSVPAAP